MEVNEKPYEDLQIFSLDDEANGEVRMCFFVLNRNISRPLVSELC